MYNKYIKINDYNDFEYFVQKVNYFQDSMLREVEILSRGYVDRENRMYGDNGPYDIRVIIHTQHNSGYCIDLIFEEVTEYVFFSMYEIDVELVNDVDEIIMYLSQPGTTKRAYVKAKAMSYRILDKDCLGKKSLISQPIYINDAKLANDLGDDWVQCDSCSESWEVKKDQEFIVCPNCDMIYINPYSITKSEK